MTIIAVASQKMASRWFPVASRSKRSASRLIDSFHPSARGFKPSRIFGLAMLSGCEVVKGQGPENRLTAFVNSVMTVLAEHPTGTRQDKNERVGCKESR